MSVCVSLFARVFACLCMDLMVRVFGLCACLFDCRCVCLRGS